MKTNVYKRFDPRVMEREERIGINRGLPTMTVAQIALFLFILKVANIRCFILIKCSEQEARFKKYAIMS
jgi:hypothetical protein